MKSSTVTEGEIVQVLQNFVTAFESGDKDSIQNILAKEVIVHVRDLDLHGRAAFFELYKPVSMSITKMSIRACGEIGWGYGRLEAKKNLHLYATAVLERQQNLGWKIVHLHISDHDL